jgi:hypothetical protein
MCVLVLLITIEPINIFYGRSKTNLVKNERGDLLVDPQKMLTR